MSTETVLITGATSGIGLEMARLFAAQGARLVLVARRRDRLQALADALTAQHQTTVNVMEADLSESAAPQQIMHQLAALGLHVDVLVNNAGFGLLGDHASLDLQRQLDMVQVNVTALMHLTHLLLPAMIARNRGGVLNVASTAAFQAGPGMAVYYASKAFVLSYTEALHEELRHTRLRVSCLCPGPTHTEFVEVAGMQGVGLFKLGAQSAQAVARHGLRSWAANRAIAISGLGNQALTGLGKLSPRWLARKVAGFLNRV